MIVNCKCNEFYVTLPIKLVEKRYMSLALRTCVICALTSRLRIPHKTLYSTSSIRSFCLKKYCNVTSYQHQNHDKMPFVNKEINYLQEFRMFSNHKCKNAEAPAAKLSKLPCH